MTIARGGTTDRVPVALIVDSPWLPGHVGVDTLDYFLHADVWWQANRALLTRRAQLPFEVFNFSHETDFADAQIRRFPVC